MCNKFLKLNNKVVFVKRIERDEICIYSLNNHWDFKAEWFPRIKMIGKLKRLNPLDYILNIFTINTLKNYNNNL